MEKSLHASLLRSHGREVLKQLRKMENITLKTARWSNHIVYNKRCRHDNLTPPSIKLNTTMNGRKVEAIIHKAEQALLRERTQQCIFTIKKLKIELEEFENNFYGKLETEPEVAQRAKMFLADLYTRESEKCKWRQKDKFLKLKTKTQGKIDDNTGENIKERWVVNRSSRTLSEDENKLLMRGLKFAITPTKLPIYELVTATEEACYAIKDRKTGVPT